MADLKSFINTSSDRIKSAMGVPVDRIKTIQGSLLNRNEPEVEAYITGLVTPLSEEQKTKLNTLITSLKSALNVTSLSSAFDIFYILAGETAESSLKNIAKDAHHATNVNGMTFSPLEGFTGNGTSQYLSTNYILGSDSSVITTSSHSFGFYSRTIGLASKHNWGVATGTDKSTFYHSMIYEGSTKSYQILGKYFPSIIQNTKGLFINSRTTALYSYRNGSQTGSTSNPTAILPDLNMVISALNTNGTISSFSSLQYSLFFAGKSLTAQNVTDITTAFETYMDSNGKGVIA